MVAGRHAEHRSHNPLEALMVYAFWGTLLVIIGTGVEMAGLPTTRTPVATAAAGDRHSGEEQEGRGEREAGIAQEVHLSALLQWEPCGRS